jgi:hypothetical protein
MASSAARANSTASARPWLQLVSGEHVYPSVWRDDGVLSSLVWEGVPQAVRADAWVLFSGAVRARCAAGAMQPAVRVLRERRRSIQTPLIMLATLLIILAPVPRMQRGTIYDRRVSSRLTR